MKTSDLAERLGVSQLQVRNELMTLEQQGAVTRTGHTRGTRWYLGDRKKGNDEPREHAKPAVNQQATEVDDDGESVGMRKGPKERVLDAHRALLGQLPDADVATKTGVSIRTIAGYRKKHGIPGYTGPRRRAGRPESAPETLHAPATHNGGATGAWRIEIRHRQQTLVRYALAGNLVDAARAASDGAATAGGEVVSIAFAGELL